MRWGTGRVQSGAEVTKAQSVQIGPSVLLVRCMEWDRMLTSDLWGDSPWSAAWGKSAAPGTDERERNGPVWNWVHNDSLPVNGR